MGFLSDKNSWVRYFTRTYQQLLDNILTTLGTNVPEMTDHTASNPYVVNAAINSGIAEMLGYYIDNAGRESFIDSARLYKSLVSHAKQFDYKITGNLPYSTSVKFTIDVAQGIAGTIPAGTVVKSSSTNIKYTTTENAIIAIGDLVSSIVPAVQYEQVLASPLGNSPGIADMEIVFTDKVVHDSILLYVNALAWNAKDTLAYSLSTDQDFVQTVNKDKIIVIYTGNGVFSGAIPTIGQPMTADYKVTLGLKGFVDTGDIDTIVSVITPYLFSPPSITVTNITRASGAADPEDIDSLKRNIPISLRTLNRMVTEDDYHDVAITAPGVAEAGASFNCGKKVTIYIYPIGGGIASGSLITNTFNFLDDKRMFTTKIEIKAAGEVRILIEANITSLPNYQNVVTKQNAEDAITSFISYLNQNIQGQLTIGDIYQKIEEAAGVANSVIAKITAVPYGRPLGTTASVLDWSVSTNNSSIGTLLWRIVFTDNTHYKLIRQNLLLGTFAVGALVNQYELSLNVNSGSYVTGDSFSFNTYAYNFSKLLLTEPSLPVSLSADLSFNVTGGL